MKLIGEIAGALLRQPVVVVELRAQLEDGIADLLLILAQ